jgi:hypothetical protein
MIAPRNKEELYVNICYTFNSFLFLLLIYRSYKPNASMAKTLYPAFILTLIRLTIRLIDFENTKQYMTDKEWYSFANLMVITFHIYITIFLFSFHNLRGSYFFFVLLIYFSDMSQKSDAGLLRDERDFYEWNYLYMFVFPPIAVYLYSNQQQTIFKAQRILLNRFKKIMDKSGEGIVIIKEKNTIEYLNDKFIE